MLIYSQLKHLYTILFLLLNINGLFSQEMSLLQTIAQDAAVDVYLKLDWKDLTKHKNEKAYISATVKIITGKREVYNLTGKVRTRGHMRLQICSFPPLKLKLDKNELTGLGLSTMNEMDIINHCEASEMYDQLILREYMAYKLWELVSPYYFKVQLIKLHYLNLDESEAHRTAYAFLMENIEELVVRLGARQNKTPIISSNAVEKEPMLKAALFEYMIGNTDWYITNRHNLEFIAIPGYTVLVPVPYDFDYSGLVDAPYAAHHESLDIASVNTRYYQGGCATEEQVTKVLKIFQEQKEKILTTPKYIEGLDEKSINYTTSYLKDFYAIIENPKKLENFILEHCDMWPVNK